MIVLDWSNVGGVASELDLVILDPEWSGFGRTGAPGAPVLYPNRKEVKGGGTNIY